VTGRGKRATSWAIAGVAGDGRGLTGGSGTLRRKRRDQAGRQQVAGRRRRHRQRDEQRRVVLDTGVTCSSPSEGRDHSSEWSRRADAKRRPGTAIGVSTVRGRRDSAAWGAATDLGGRR